ncbi:MAG: hypothetical protein WCA00_12045 [Candidatus Acidiferrales bacterium]
MWLPAQVKEFVQLQHDPAPWGTPDYHRDREVHLNSTRHVLLLDALGAAALCGLCIVVAGVLSWRGELAIWIVIAAAGGSIAQFMHAWILPGKESTAPYIFAVDVPASIAVIAVAGAVATLASRFLRKPAAP